MMRYTIYEISSGQIVGHGTTDEPQSLSDLGVGRAALIDQPPDITPDRHYVTGSPAAVVQRPALGATLNKPSIAANGVDQAILSGVPAGATIKVRDVHGMSDYLADGTTLEITADEPGRITVEVEAFPAAVTRYTVTAV